MKRILILSLVLIPVLGFLYCGCGDRAMPETGMTHAGASVSFPALQLERDEYIQSVTLEIRCGRVSAVNCLLDDWDLELTWDNPALLELKMHARHFPAGLADLKVLNNFITVESQPGETLRLSAKLVSSSTDPTGRADRTYEIPHLDFLLTPRAGKGG